ncbi:MAG: UDP-N-acetylmuramate--L-alanine ligase [Bacteroidia bacterium]|nr:UDP-N-acetylmuramate--L-alanine ligase [Bacteroidia bacterium]
MNEAKNIYFLGIGGIGMSALAHYFHLKGKTVSGYDRSKSIVTDQLESEGMQIFYTMDADHLRGQDMMIYTPAISRESVEYTAAIRAGIPTLKRSQALGEISRSFRTLAVAGTHGKTTTSTMLTHVLQSSDIDCTAFLGGISNNLKANFILGSTDFLVVEADEYDRSFLTLNPEIAVITSLDADHLDIYGTAEAMRENYVLFAGQSENLLVEESLKDYFTGRQVETFGVSNGTYYAENLRFENLSTTFDFVSPTGKMADLSLPMPGRHNVKNMVAAIAVALRCGASEAGIRKAVTTFSGIYRRFEVHTHNRELTYVDDYAHHPSEIEAVVRTARDLFPERKLVVVFQPHLFTRTRDFLEGFAGELSKADAVLLMDIYPAREEPIPGITSEQLLNRITTEEKVLVTKETLTERLKEMIQKPAVVMSLGAGDIDRETSKIKKLTEDLYKNN